MNSKAWFVTLGMFLAAGLVVYGLGLTPYWWVWLLSMVLGYGLSMWSAIKNTPLVYFQASFIVGTISLVMLLMSGVVGVLHLVGR